MSIIKSDLDKIEFVNYIVALIILGVVAGICAIITFNVPPAKVLMQSITASLVSVWIVVYFINYRTVVDKQKFKKLYLSKFSPILKRLFMYLYIRLKKLVKFENDAIRTMDYKPILTRCEELILDRTYIQRYRLDKIFPAYKEILVHQTNINSNFLPPNLVLNISEITERLESLDLQIQIMRLESNDGELVLKNVKAIFKHLNIIDDIDGLKLNLDPEGAFDE